MNATQTKGLRFAAPVFRSTQDRATSGVVNVRFVTLDGVHVGVLRGIYPSPSNPSRPTAFHWTWATGGPRSGETTIYTRLAEARAAITQELSR